MLHELTDGRAYLRNVDIVVPSSWDTNGCQRTVVKSPIVREADIRIGPTHPLFGDRPWTKQSQNCWKPGDFVSLSVPFLTEGSANNSGRGLQLLNQWARYRYGVFEDALCAAGKVCASAKHGRLCNDTSPQRIVLGHDDFKNSQPVNRTATTFTYWSPTWPKVIVAVDHVIGSVDRDAWNYTRVALRMFLDYMEPNELEFGLVAYSNNTSETFQELTKTKWRNLDHMAGMSALAKSVDGESCLHCAMDRAVRMLEANGSSAAGHAVILITNGSLSAQMAANVTILARQKQLRVSVVAMGFKSADQVANDLKQLTKETNGYFAAVPFRKTAVLDVQHIQFVNVSAILDLEDALVAALTHHSASLPIDLPVTIHNKMFAMGNRPLTADKEERNGN